VSLTPPDAQLGFVYSLEQWFQSLLVVELRLF
jgi:hypothetical protein